MGNGAVLCWAPGRDRQAQDVIKTLTWLTNNQPTLFRLGGRDCGGAMLDNAVYVLYMVTITGEEEYSTFTELETIHHPHLAPAL